jgi:hypothetical protein
MTLLEQHHRAEGQWRVKRQRMGTIDIKDVYLVLLTDAAIQNASLR